MAFKKMFWGHTIVLKRVLGPRILIHRDGTINRKDLEKLTMDDLYHIMKFQCSGRVKDSMIALIMEGTNKN